MKMNKPINAQPLTEYLFHKASRKKIPLSGTFELSPICNFACRMCYVRKTPQEVRAHSRPLVTLDQWLDIARQARDQGTLNLLLTGGEPFLWPDFWKLYEELIRMGFLIAINTNGSMIDDAALERLKAMPPARINLTLYGASDDTYEALCQTKNVFSRVDHAINGLKEIGIPLKINCSLTPQNAGDLEKIVSYAKDRDLPLAVTDYMFPPIRRDAGMVGQNDRFTPREAAYYHMKRYQLQNGQEAYIRFLENIVSGLTPPLGLEESCIDPVDGKIRCRAGNASFWITWDGWMTPCGTMTEPKVDLMDRSFSDAWKQIVDISGELALSGVCAQCPDRQMCHSCAAMALAETGTHSGIPKYLCQTVQEMKNLASEELADGNSAKL